MFNVTLFPWMINITSFIGELTLSVISVSQSEIEKFWKKLDLILLVLFKLGSLVGTNITNLFILIKKAICILSLNRV